MHHTFQVPGAEGWTLAMTHVRGDGPPVLLVPGYGMNRFILGYHPGGVSLMDHLAAAGLDVFSVDLRGQGDSFGGDRRRISLAKLALVDLPMAVRVVQERTGADRVHLIGCSLGGTLLYTWMAHDPGAPVDRCVSMGGPMDWPTRGPIVRAFSAVAPLAKHVPVRGVRPLARLALPVITRVAPGLLRPYMHHDLVDLEHADQLVRTVDDPARALNAELGDWVGRGTLQVGGTQVGPALAQVDRPLMLITASGDGIAPPDACQTALDAWGGPTEHLEVGSPERPWAHADLFIARDAHAQVFDPIAGFLTQ